MGIYSMHTNVQFTLYHQPYDTNYQENLFAKITLIQSTNCIESSICVCAVTRRNYTLLKTYGTVSK